jgi:UPF0271 protein
MARLLIDLNCDLGEDDSPEGLARDVALLEHVTSANIACGGHAGSAETMRVVAKACLERGVRIGAHPGYEDRANFGRVELALDARAVQDSVCAQVRALAEIVSSLGGALSHVKPHGAMYHAAMRSEEVARAVAEATEAATGRVALVGLAGANGLAHWNEWGWPTMAEAFADRRYEPDGSLRARTRPGAVLERPELAAAQALGLAQGRGVRLDDGTTLAVHASTLCIHSDSPGSLDAARAVAAALRVR